jgi:hypothetical protein
VAEPDTARKIRTRPYVDDAKMPVSKGLDCLINFSPFNLTFANDLQTVRRYVNDKQNEIRKNIGTWSNRESG